MKKDVKYPSVTVMSFILLLVTLLIIMTACSNGDSDSQLPPTEGESVEGQLSEEPEPPTQENTPSISLDEVIRIFDSWNELIERDGGELWGFSLQIPILFVDSEETRIVIANQPDLEGFLQYQDGVYVGHLPDDYFLPVGTDSDYYFGGIRWVSTLWNTFSQSYQQMQLLSHYAMHWHQPIIFGSNEIFRRRDNTHMHEEFARISIRLETNALLQALRSTDDERFEAITDALSIRAERRRLFGDRDENIFELAEGLAFYTERLLTTQNFIISTSDIPSFVQNLRMNDGMEHLFGYGTGALYAFLLFESGMSWKPYLTLDSDLGSMLQEVLGITQLRDFDDLDLQQYGYTTISYEERSWVEARAYFLQEIFDELENYPQLRVYSSEVGTPTVGIMAWQFSEIPELGWFQRGMGEITGSFGRLDIHNNNNFVILTFDDDFGTIAIAHDMEISDGRVTARNWVLELEDGYHVICNGDGNFRISRIE